MNDVHRRGLERNTGAVIEIVVEKSPAFYTNVLPGDVLIKINGVDVRDAAHAIKLMTQINTNDKTATFTVIRNNKEKQIEIDFTKT